MGLHMYCFSQQLNSIQKKHKANSPAKLDFGYKTASFLCQIVHSSRKTVGGGSVKVGVLLMTHMKSVYVLTKKFAHSLVTLPHFLSWTRNRGRPPLHTILHNSSPAKSNNKIANKTVNTSLAASIVHVEEQKRRTERNNHCGFNSNLASSLGACKTPPTQMRLQCLALQPVASPAPGPGRLNPLWIIWALQLTAVAIESKLHSFWIIVIHQHLSVWAAGWGTKLWADTLFAETMPSYLWWECVQQCYLSALQHIHP